jgi:hypothetical protein
MRGIRERLAQDDGMTLIEVVIAAVIMFVILTGVLGLLGQTISMGQQAKRMNVATNAINAYVEWVRAQPFDTIESGAGGSIETTTFVVEEFTITIEPVIEDGENEALKNLIMSVAVVRADGYSYAYQTTVIIRDRDQHMTAVARSPSTDPKIAFASPTPPDGTVVWYEDGGSWWMDAGGNLYPLQLSVSVEAGDGRTVTEVEIWCDDSFRIENSAGEPAYWENPDWELLTSPFSWDLMQKDSLGEMRVHDGMRSIVAYVRDSNNIAVYTSRQFFVDTFAPEGSPEPIVHSPAGSMGGNLTWEIVYDEGTPAFAYVVTLSRQAVDGTWTSVQGSPFEITANAYAVPSEPLARFSGSVYATSPLGRQSDEGAITPFVTRPTLAASTYLYKTHPTKWEMTPTLRASAPTFLVAGAVTYTWYRVGVTAPLGTTTENSFTAPLVQGQTPSYYARVTLTPEGGAEVTVTSETITLAKQASSGTYTVSPGVW